MAKIIDHYDKMMNNVFSQENVERDFDIEKDLPNLLKHYEQILKPDFLFVIDMRISGNRLVFEKNYTLKSDKGEVDFELLMNSIPVKELGVLIEVDSIASVFINAYFKKPFQYLMNVGMPVELVKGESQYLLRTGTVLSFDKNGIADYAISYFKDITPITGPKKALSYYISANESEFKDLDSMTEQFNNLLQSKLLLTQQERKVLSSVKLGKTSKVIADELCITKSTVDTHRQNIIRKLKVKNTNEALQKALEFGII